MITSADVMRLSRFPAIRREFSDALVQQPIAAEITPSRVWFGLKNRAAFHPALFTLAHPDGKTTLVIGTPKAKVLKPAALASFLRRMGWTGGRWTRVLGNKGHRDLVYQLRKANIIGGSETVAVLVPRQRVERTAGKFMRGSTRANPDDLSRLKQDRERVLRLLNRPRHMSSRVFQQLMAEVARLNRAIGRLEGRPVNVNRNPRQISPKLAAAVRAAEKEAFDFLHVWDVKGDVVTLDPKPKDPLCVQGAETVMREHGYRVRWSSERGMLGFNPLTRKESARALRDARGTARWGGGLSDPASRAFFRGKARGMAGMVHRYGPRAARLMAEKIATRILGDKSTWGQNPLTRKESAAILREARMDVLRSKHFEPKSKERVRGAAWQAAQIVQRYGVAAAKRATEVIQSRSHGLSGSAYRKYARLNPLTRKEKVEYILLRKGTRVFISARELDIWKRHQKLQPSTPLVESVKHGGWDVLKAVDGRVISSMSGKYPAGAKTRLWLGKKNPLTDRESATVIREARRQYGYARKAKGRSKYDHGLHRGYALGLLEVGRRFGFASPKAQKAGEHVIQQAMKNPAAKKSRRNVPRRNPILATLGIAANPNPKVQNINIPFRDGQKVTTAQIERWIKTLPNGPLRTMYEARFGMGQKQYKRFHLGSVVKTWTWKTVPVGANKRITDVDFVVSEGKEWSAAYQVPPHSKKYTKDTQGRYLHAHGDSGIDIKTIKHPAKPSKLPERFHTADGLFVGVIPKKGSITDWYRH